MRAFTAFGVPVRFHFTFLLLVAFLIMLGLEDGPSAIGDITFISSLFASVILHELGHAVVARHYGVKTIEIVMFPIGGVARLERTPPARKELWIAAAGPLVNLVIAGILFGIAAFTKGSVAGVETLVHPSEANLLERIAYGNLILALFNLLPAFPMDGGRILRSVLAIWRSEDEATRIASRAGRTLAIAMGLYGLISMQFMLIFIAFFVYLGAAQEGQVAVGRALTQGQPVRVAMISKFHTLPHGATVGDAAQLLLATAQQDFPVVHGEQVLGLLDRNSLLRAMASEGADAYITAYVDREFLKLSPDMDLAEAMTLLTNSGPCALVMDGDRLLGLLTKENLSEFLLLRKVGLAPQPRR
jgi:Zn-dependent protease